MNKEQKTIKKIQELVPEIMELKFGCKVISQIKDGTQKFEHIIIGSKIIGTNCYPTSYNTFVNEDQIIEIIGKDITLEDVLITFGDRIHNDDRIGDLIYGMTYSWKFNKPFQDQSQETKDFIGDLLNVNFVDVK